MSNLNSNIMRLKMILSKFNTSCNETGKAIHRGTMCFWDLDTGRVYHGSSKVVKKFRESDKQAK